MSRSQLVVVTALALASSARADDLPVKDPPADPPVVAPPVAPAPIVEPVDQVTINGGFWLNYTYNLFDPTDRDKGGDFGPGNSMFRIGFDAKRKGFLGSVRLRWYSYARVWEYGWVGYRWVNGSQVEVGLTKVPFGVLPYAAYDYWFNLPYYVGLNNQYDVGAKWSGAFLDKRLEVQVGFFKNADIAAPDDLARFSYDTVLVADNPLARNEESNQGNARVAFTTAGIETGASVQYGGLYNHDTGDTGRHWAAALHINAAIGNWSAQLQAMQYAFSPKNAAGESRDIVVAGAFADAYPIAAKARILEANIGYEFHFTKWIDSIKLYNNFSTLLKDSAAFRDSKMNVAGFSVLAGPIFGFVDVISAKNAPYIGTPTAIAFTTGDPDDEWHSMVNINLGFYFKTHPLEWAR